MKITNDCIYGMEESIIAAGLPMNKAGADYDRAVRLGNTPIGSGHNNYLKGIIVQFDWKNSCLIQRQVLRYNFIDIVSSQSTMHRATTMDVEGQCNSYVDKRIINIIKELISEYNASSDVADKKHLELIILNSLPMGYELKARYTTNYSQLKTIYNQRKNHKLPEWKVFCDWCLTLPNFKLLTGVE